MIAALLCGAGVGTGLFLVARGVAPPRPSLAQALAQLRRPPEPPAMLTAEDPGGFAARLGRPARRGPRPGRSRGPHLAAGATRPGRARPQHASGTWPRRSPWPSSGSCSSPPAPGCSPWPARPSLWRCPCGDRWCAVLAGFVLPDLGIHSEAEARRRDFRHALGSFLDLVVIALAGGGGVETALADAASVGEGWAFDELRHSLDAARLARDTPWSALERLGNELGVAELGELAASVGLAGAEGAKVRASLGAKAASLALPPAGRGRDDRPGGHREDEPSRRAALRRVPLLHRLPGHRARPGRTVRQP